MNDVIFSMVCVWNVIFIYVFRWVWRKLWLLVVFVEGFFFEEEVEVEYF